MLGLQKKEADQESGKHMWLGQAQANLASCSWCRNTRNVCGRYKHLAIQI